MQYKGVRLCGIVLVLTVALCGCSDQQVREKRDRLPAPVEAVPLETGDIRALRVFSGALEAQSAFVVAPKIGGRLESIEVDLGDSVKHGQIVARLDDAEYRQDLAQQEADLLVAEANLKEAASTFDIAKRNMARTETLSQRGVASAVELDAARSDLLAREAAVEVKRALVKRMEAAVEAERIRLGYAAVQALWEEGDTERVVARRFVDEGQTVSANTPLLEIVNLDPLSGTFFVTEKDYPKLSIDQPVKVRTDAYPDLVFTGHIERIAPVFDENSRQARVEIRVPNRDQALKPGMFLRAEVEVDRAENAVIAPEEAIVVRDDVAGIFLVAADGSHARWQPVALGIREGGRVQIKGAGAGGHVITLGQHLIEDGSAIAVANPGSVVSGDHAP